MSQEIQGAQPAQPKLEDIEQYRMQMAGISTAAIGYWKEGDSIHPDYDTVALRDVARLYAKYDALYKAAAIPAPDPAPAKPFFAYDPENGIEWFETMQEAQAYAAESLREYRRSASFDGEWSGDVEAVKVGHVTHFVAEHGDDESGYDYRLVTAIPAPEGADWTDVRMELEASGRADLSAWVASKLAAPAPQAPVALTDERIAEAARSAHIAFALGKHRTYEHALTRAVERAHGIPAPKETKA